MHRLWMLLLFFGTGLTICAATGFEFPDLSRRIPERPTTPGCAYKGERYNHSEQVETTEPCLNCTCIRAVVVCYLRVCPSAPSPPPGCFLAREPGQCCPTLVCGGDEKKKPYPEESSSVPDLRPTFQPVQDETTTHQEENSLVFVSSTEPEEDIPFLNDIPGGCLVNGTLYGDGSAMLSSSFCEYCFCIRGKTTCLKPKCDLVIEGCSPFYDSHFACCPSRYECYQKTFVTEDIKTTEATPVTLSSTTVSTTGFSDSCILDGHVYHQGEVIPDYRACHSCYCSNLTIVCDEIKCSPPLSGCHPIIPEGHCCPVSYKCDYHGDSGNYNSKGISSNTSYPETETKRSDIKTVKQSELFKNNHSPNIEVRPKLPPVSKELSTFFHNFVPIHRRLEEDIAELYLSSGDKLYSNEDLLEHSINSQNVTPHVRENDKTLDLEELHAQELTTESYFTLEIDTENSKDQTHQTAIPYDSTENKGEHMHTVSVGSPDEQLFTIQEFLNQFFTNNHANSSKSVTEESLEPKRNNSKQASSIGGILDSKTTPSFYYTHTNKISTSDKTNEPSDIIKNQYTTPTPQENGPVIITTLSDIPLSSTTEQDLNPALIRTTLYFEEDDEMLSQTDRSTAYIIRGTKNNRTLSTAPQRTSTPVWHVTESPSNLDFKSSTIKEEPSTTKTIKNSTRLNSKLPSSSYRDTATGESLLNSRYPMLEDSLVNLYLPAEGRDADDDADFTNVGAIHLGAPLSVAATELRRDPANLRNKITESGGVIFMDPKYTDINPNLPSTKIQPKPTETNPIGDRSFEFTDYPTPIERSDVDYTNHDPKKSPRIQDVYNQTNAGQDFKIIPFVAEDAIRGIFGKGNNTFHILQDSTQEPPDMVSDFCFIKGRIFKNGEMIVKSDPCELCRCFYGQELCQLQRCPIPPPDCTPEKLPAFCCPRYTCGNNASVKEHSSQEQNIAIDVPSNNQFVHPTIKLDIFEKTRLSSLNPEEAKFGIRVRPRPIPISKPMQTTPKEATQNPQRVTTTTRRPEFARTHVTQQAQESVRTANSQIEEFTRSSTRRIPTRVSTTKQPETTKKDSSSYFPDPWGLLKVSGCNIYGKFFNINDQVEILSGPCSHCICTTNGVECNDIC